MTEIDLSLLKTKKEKADELGISTKTLDRWVKENKITYIKVKTSSRRWFLPKNDFINP